jgi:glycosyltransferase involved in cell wall biosynthesis
MERLSFELMAELKKLPDLAVTTLVRSGTGRLGAILFVLSSLPRALSFARQADVVHVGDPVLSLHAWLIKKIFHKPVAVTIHGLDVTYANPLYQVYLKMFGQFDLALPISEHAASLLKASSIKHQASRVITPGVYDRYFDPTLTRSNLAELLQRTTTYNLPPTTSVIFTAGRLVKRKGHAWFIEHVLPHLPKDTVYLIAGDGPERAHLESLKNSQVLLLGRVSDADLKTLYNTVDAFIQPNIAIPGDAEGFGLVLLEAALCQRPVFASRLDGIPDAIHDGKNGTLLPAGSAQAWITALSKPLQPAPLTRHYTLETFSWPVQAQKYLQALRTIVAIASDKG